MTARWRNISSKDWPRTTKELYSTLPGRSEYANYTPTTSEPLPQGNSNRRESSVSSERRNWLSNSSNKSSRNSKSKKSKSHLMSLRKASGSPSTSTTSSPGTPKRKTPKSWRKPNSKLGTLSKASSRTKWAALALTSREKKKWST